MAVPTGREGRITTAAIAPRVGRWQWPRVSIGPYLVLAVLAGAVFVPLIFLVIGSFSTARIPTNTNWSTISLTNYAAIWLDPQTYRQLPNTVIFVDGATALGIALA